MTTTGVNSKNVFTGAPDQATTGAVLQAPIGTALPTTLVATIDTAFGDTGYITEDGVTVTPDRSLTAIKDWSGQTIRNVIKEFTNVIAFAFLETSAASLKAYFGDANVTVTAPTSSVGTLITSKLNASDMPHKCWIVKVKDGPRQVLIVVPDGQVTKQEKLAFMQSDGLDYGVELTTYPDSSGNHVYFYTTDGVFTA